MLTDCTATLCSFAMQHVVPSERLVVPETPLPALLPVWQSSRLQLCLTIQYCSASLAIQYCPPGAICSMVGYVALKSRGNEKSENNNPGFLAERAGLVLPVAILSIFLFARRHHNQRERALRWIIIIYQRVANIGRPIVISTLGQHLHCNVFTLDNTITTYMICVDKLYYTRIPWEMYARICLPYLYVATPAL